MDDQKYQQLLKQCEKEDTQIQDEDKRKYLAKNGKLYTLQDQQEKRVLRIWEVEAVLLEAHGGLTRGHFRVKATTSCIRKRFWWPKMVNQISDYVESCEVCQKKNRRRMIPPMVPIEVEGPFDRIGIDFVGPLPVTSRGNQFILVATDYFTKYPEARATFNNRAATVAQFIFEEIICRHGCPKKIQTDRGSHFNCQLVKELCNQFNIKYIPVSPYHPQANGLVERFNGTLCTALAKFVQHEKDEWDRYIPGTLMAYRSTQQHTTKFSPSYLTYGREFRLPLDLEWGIEQSSPQTILERTAQIVTRFEPDQAQALANIQEQQPRQKKQHDKKAKQKEFYIGDKVLRHVTKLLTSHSAKFDDQWEGPFRIHQVFGNGTYKLRNMQDELIRAPAHGSRLKLYKEREFQPTVLIEPTPLQETTNEENTQEQQ